MTESENELKMKFCFCNSLIVFDAQSYCMHYMVQTFMEIHVVPGSCMISVTTVSLMQHTQAECFANLDPCCYITGPCNTSSAKPTHLSFHEGLKQARGYKTDNVCVP